MDNTLHVYTKKHAYTCLHLVFGLTIAVKTSKVISSCIISSVTAVFMYLVLRSAYALTVPHVAHLLQYQAYRVAQGQCKSAMSCDSGEPLVLINRQTHPPVEGLRKNVHETR
jgi:hypothetical protein